jgi:hypothetical protein
VSAPDRRLTLDRDDPTLSLRRQCALVAVARSGVSQWKGFYNHHRPHQALRNRAPMAIWREAMIGALPPMAVAMALAVAASLVDATASTTSPQPQQQQKAACFSWRSERRDFQLNFPGPWSSSQGPAHFFCKLK